MQVTDLTPQTIRPLLARQLESDDFDRQWLRLRLRDMVASRLQHMFPTADQGVMECVLEMGETVGKSVSRLSELYPKKPSWELAESAILDHDLLSLLMRHLSLPSVHVRLVCTTWRAAVQEWRCATLELNLEIVGLRPSGVAPTASGLLLASGANALVHLRRDGGLARRETQPNDAEPCAAPSAPATPVHMTRLTWGGHGHAAAEAFGCGVACDGSTVYTVRANKLVAVTSVDVLSAEPMASALADTHAFDTSQVRVAAEQPSDAVADDASSGIRRLPATIHGNEACQLALPAGLACANGMIYVADPHHHRVVEYDARALAPVRSFGAVWGVDARYQPLPEVAAGMERWQPAELHSPRAIAVHGTEVFVCDEKVAPLSPFHGPFDCRVAVFRRSDARCVRSVGPFARPQGVAVVPPAAERSLAVALLVVCERDRTHLRRLSGEPWQVVQLGGDAVSWSRAEERLFLVDQLAWSRPAGLVGVVHVLRLDPVGHGRLAPATERCIAR
jgi:hypothetical protein